MLGDVSELHITTSELFLGACQPFLSKNGTSVSACLSFLGKNGTPVGACQPFLSKNGTSVST